MTGADVVRIHALAGEPADVPRLVLERGVLRLDLSAALRREGRPDDLVELARAGALERAALDALVERSLDLELARGDGAPLPLAVPTPPARVGKILALGKNFRAHAEEFGEEVPTEPLFFNKLPETLVPHGATVRVPAWYAGRFDHEAELAVLIGRSGRDVPRASALEHVAGYSVANDLTARSLQGRDRERRHPWFRAKNLDGSCPLGPCLVPRDYLDVGDLRVTARVGGELRQDARTRDWIVDVPHAIEHLSRHLTLRAGDWILMGTPAGVGPLHDGDEVVCEVEGIGRLATRIARGAGAGA